MENEAAKRREGFEFFHHAAEKLNVSNNPNRLVHRAIVRQSLMLNHQCSHRKYGTFTPQKKFRKDEMEVNMLEDATN